jgi:hypothetical protein
MDSGKIPSVVEPAEYQISVEFPNRLRLHTLEPVRVLVSPMRPIEPLVPLARKNAYDPLPLRLQVPGANVSPPELGIVPSPFGTVEAVFTVCALAEGRIPGARLEIFRQGVLDTVPLPLQFGRNRWPMRVLFAAVIIPILLFLPAIRPVLGSSGELGRMVKAWLPSVPQIADPIANAIQWLYRFLAGPGADMSLSFYVLLVLMPIAAIVWIANRAQPITVAGTAFTIGDPISPPKPAGILTPLSDEELKEVQKGESRRVAAR